MTRLQGLLRELDETMIADRVTNSHDEVRLRYSVDRNRVRDFDEYVRALGDYYNYHVSATVMQRGRLRDEEARGYAKQIIQHHYQHRYQGDFATAFQDALTGKRGGLRLQLDVIADRLKAEAVERYVSEVFDRYVVPSDWASKVELIRQFMTQIRVSLPSWIDIRNPERYARDYQELIRGFVWGLREAWDLWRRG